MRTDTAISGEYLLSATAIRIWQTNDEAGQDKMFISITETCKEKWFNGLIYNITIIPKYKLLEKAEDAFLKAWISFNERGKAGKIKFKETDYTPYLKQTFRNIFFELLLKEIKETEAIDEFERRKKLEDEDEDIQTKKTLLYKKLKKTLTSLSAEENDLLQMRFVENKSYSVIAEKFQILKKSCIQKVYRTKLEIIKSMKL